MTTRSANLGFPRIGTHRELKQVTELYWKGEIDSATHDAATDEVRAANWRLQRDAGIDVSPSKDFSLCDQVLDMIATPDCGLKTHAWREVEAAIAIWSRPPA